MTESRGTNSSGKVKLNRAVQIGIVVRDLEKTTRFLSSLFGLGPFHFIEWPNRPDSKFYYRGEEKHIKLKQAFLQVGPLEIEFVQPLEGDVNAYREFLQHHQGRRTFHHSLLYFWEHLHLNPAMHSRSCVHPSRSLVRRHNPSTI